MFKYLMLSTTLLTMGLFGMIVASRHLIVMLMSLEIMLLASSVNFVVFSVYFDDILGQMFCLLVLTMGAAESALGLAIMIVYYRLRGSISVKSIHHLKG